MKDEGLALVRKRLIDKVANKMQDKNVSHKNKYCIFYICREKGHLSMVVPLVTLLSSTHQFIQICLGGPKMTLVLER